MTCDHSPHAAAVGPRYAPGMRTTLFLTLGLAAALAGCGPGGPTTDLTEEFQTDVCASESGSPTPTNFLAASSTATAVTHQLASGDTPYMVTLPTGAPGYVGVHVSEMHTTMEIIVKHSTDVSDVVTQGGTATDIVYDRGAVPGTACHDLYYYKLHADTPGDYEIQLPSNATNTVWIAYKIVLVGHDI